ncbi:MAB_1171c family putative transporter [Rhodococcus jostii]|uniref:MAB_1171c family putative transporter n=1 Tax=Rhodococcus jostii TaxID=132919 RepID=UPI0036309641
MDLIHTSILIRAAVLAVIIIWRSWQLVCRRGNPSSWAMVAVMMCLAAALVAEWFALGHPPSYAWVWLEHLLLMAAVYCLNLYFVVAVCRGQAALRAAIWTLIPLLVSAAAAAVFAGRVPAGTPPYELTAPGVVGFYLSVKLYLPIGFLTACGFCEYHARRAVGPLRAALAVTGTGLLLIALAEVATTVELAHVIAGSSTPPLLHLAAQVTIGAGIVLFLTGIVVPGVAHRRRAWRLRATHRDQYRRMTDLGNDLGRTFPQLPLRYHSGGGRNEREILHGIHDRHYRRFIEIRDGLVLLSPHLADLPGPPLPERTPDRIARDIAAALGEREHGAHARGPAQQVLTGNVYSEAGDVETIVELATAYTHWKRRAHV